MTEMKDAITDIIIVSNALVCIEKKEIAEYIKKHLNRDCNVINVTNLESMRILQRIMYGLLEKDNFIASDDDRAVLNSLSEHSQGSATLVHILASLMQKYDDNRVSFQHIKQQLNAVGHNQPPNQLQNPCILNMLRISLTACSYNLLRILSIFGPVPLPLFISRSLRICYHLIKNRCQVSHK